MGGDSLQQVQAKSKVILEENQIVAIIDFQQDNNNPLLTGRAIVETHLHVLELLNSCIALNPDDNLYRDIMI